jgi:DNA-binding CsgD family transcriptional regulator
MSYRTEGQLYPGYTYLTPRQAEVLRLSFEGLDNRSIALRLDLSYERVRHIKQIIRCKAARGAFDTSQARKR